MNNLRVKIFADGADINGMIAMNDDPLIQGMTTNPTLMKKVGITDYEAFAKELLQTIKEKPVSFEVFSDDFAEMRRQAMRIRDWQDNVFVKIPVTNSTGESSAELIRELSKEGVKLNVTAILTLDQVREVGAALDPDTESVVSVFAGRIADTGIDPVPYMVESKAILQNRPKAQLLWASVREVFNIYQADQCRCDIVTVPHDLLAKTQKMSGMALDELSLDTVKMFKRDAEEACFQL